MTAPKAALREIHEFNLDPSKPLRVSHVTGHLVGAPTHKHVITEPVVVVESIPKVVAVEVSTTKEYVRDVFDDQNNVIAEVDVKVETKTDGEIFEEITVLPVKKVRGSKKANVEPIS